MFRDCQRAHTAADAMSMGGFRRGFIVRQAVRSRRTLCIRKELELQPEGDGETLMRFRQQPSTVELSFREISLELNHMKVGIWERVRQEKRNQLKGFYNNTRSYQ